MIIFDKTYSAEELCDIERDVIESFDPMFNPVVKAIPVDDDLGEWRVMIYYIESDK